MKQLLTLAVFFISFIVAAQDSAIKITAGKPVRIFNSTKTINARTTEVTGKGKMDFNVTHNFGDIAGDNGGISVPMTGKIGYSF
mgnify:CR=1 FL=1